MDNIDTKKRKKEFFETLPESITGPKGDKEYPLKNVQWYSESFKKRPDGIIDIDNIRSVVEWVVKCLYVDGFLTIKPLLIIAGEKEIVDIANKTSDIVTIQTFLDKSGH